MTFGSLFTGIGGMDLGLERAGMECMWQSEIDSYCRDVLRKHWPHVKQYGNIEDVFCHELEPVDLICGGFPCQDVSVAGKKAGIEGSRTGLWSEMFRIICGLRPRYVILENVPGLLIPVEYGRPAPIATVLGDLSRIGFDAEWSTVSACSMGATHMRSRVFIVAYADRIDGRSRFRNTDARSIRTLQKVDSFASSRLSAKARMANPSALYRNADGVPSGMDRNRAIGNSVHPDVAEWIGRQITRMEL